MTEPKVIWLSPQCPRAGVEICEHPDEIFADVGGRMWCEDCVWSACPACGAKPARYTLSEEGEGDESIPTPWQTAYLVGPQK